MEVAADYELDHIVPLALGGHPTDIANLQMQPWAEAKRKDRIEVKLQCLVCTGQVSLDDARREIVADWDAAYHKYAVVTCLRDRSAVGVIRPAVTWWQGFRYRVLWLASSGS